MTSTGNFLVAAYPVEIQSGDILLSALGVALTGYLIARISVKDYYKKTIFVKYIETATKCDSFTYKQIIEQARKAIGELQVAVASVSSQSTVMQKEPSGSIADEIAKLKTLLDQGIISEDEFAKAKQKLL